MDQLSDKLCASHFERSRESVLAFGANKAYPISRLRIDMCTVTVKF